MTHTSHGHHIPGSPNEKNAPKVMLRCGIGEPCRVCAREIKTWHAEQALKNARPDWDEWGLILAQAVATRADCTRRKVGAVLMRPDHTIVATGYNGGRSGGPSCLAGECPRGRMSTEEVAPGSSYDTGAGTCIALHAEQNALLRATWDQMQDAVLYITEVPCDGCMRMINGTPIKRIHYPNKVVVGMTSD